MLRQAYKLLNSKFKLKQFFHLYVANFTNLPFYILKMVDENDEDDEDARNQRLRLILLHPEDEALEHAPIITRLTETTLFNLTDENYREASEDMMDETYINLQLLRLITPDANNGAAIYNNRSRRNQMNRGRQDIQYSRMYLCRVYSSDKEERCSSLVYMMQARNVNNDLWSRDIELRDNGTLTIGTLFRVIAPHFVEKYVSNEIPLITTQVPVVIMKTPSLFLTIPIQPISGNQSLAFTLNKATIKVRRTTPVQTNCSGNLCDKQRRNELGTSRTCGCFNMSQHRSNIAIEHSLRITSSSSSPIVVDHMSSSRFSNVYLSHPIP